MTEATEHTVKRYDQELHQLTQRITAMGGLVESQLGLATRAVLDMDATLAARIVADDARIDSMERELETFAIRLLALRQPLAGDLRLIVATLKISGELERCGDYAANAAKRSVALAQFPRPLSFAGLAHLSQLVQQNLKNAVDTIGEGNAEKALDVWRADEAIDALYDNVFRELITAMMAAPENVAPCTHLLFIAKNLERIGDHATNIAETVHYAVTGVPLSEARPKADTSSYAVVRPSETP